MPEFALEYRTISRVADSSFVDRLADRVYEIEQFTNVALFLNDDGSLTATFEVEAPDPVAAIDAPLRLFFEAFLQADPLRLPRPDALEVAVNEVEPATPALPPRADELARHLLAAISSEQTTAPLKRDEVPA